MVLSSCSFSGFHRIIHSTRKVLLSIMNSPGILIYGRIVLMTCALTLQVTSDCSVCDRDVTSIQRAYCSSNFSFQGTIVDAAQYGLRSRSYPLYQRKETRRHTSGIVEYQVYIDEIFKGLDSEYLNTVVTMNADDTSRGLSQLKRGNAYLFHVNIIQHLNVCDRVDQISDISNDVIIELRLPDYVLPCPSLLHRNDEPGLPEQTDDTGDETEERMKKPRVRGNFPARTPNVSPSCPRYCRYRKPKSLKPKIWKDNKKVTKKP